MTEMKADISDFISLKQIYTDPSTWYTAFYLVNVLFFFTKYRNFKTVCFHLTRAAVSH